MPATGRPTRAVAPSIDASVCFACMGVLRGRRYTTAPPSGAGWAFDLRTRVEAVERLLKAVPAVDKHRFKLVPRVVSEELFFSNFFYKAELVRDSARVRLEAEEGEAVAAAAAAAAAAVPDADGRGQEGSGRGAAGSSQSAGLAGQTHSRPTRAAEPAAAAGSLGSSGCAISSAEDGKGRDKASPTGHLLGSSARGGDTSRHGSQGHAQTSSAAARKQSVLDALGDDADEGALGGGGLDGELDDALERAARMERPASPAAVPSTDAHASAGASADASLRDASDSAPEHDGGGPGAADEDLFDLEQLSAGGNSPSAPADGDDEVDDDELEAAIAAELAQSDEL